jgi:hypothetical protein
MTNERQRGRPSSPYRIWQTEMQLGVRLRLDLDPTALFTVFLAKTDIGTLIRDALHEYAVSHQLDSTKKEIQEEILKKAESFGELGLELTSNDFLTAKTPEEKLAEVELESKSVVARVKKPDQPKEKKPLANEMPKVAAGPKPIAAKVLDFGSQEKSKPETNLDQSNIDKTASESDKKAFAQVLLDRYSIDEDTY